MPSLDAGYQQWCIEPEKQDLRIWVLFHPALNCPGQLCDLVCCLKVKILAEHTLDVCPNLLSSKRGNNARIAVLDSRSLSIYNNVKLKIFHD